MIEIIDGTWAAGETKTFHINGEYLEILDAQYPCDVFLMDKVGSQLSTMKGCEASFFSRPREGFQTVQIRSVQAQYLRVFIGSGDAGTRRISSTVQVVDGGRARTLANAAFSGTNGIAAGGAVSKCQLVNSLGSGLRLVVKSYSASVGVSAAVSMGIVGNFVNSAGATFPVSKLSGGAGGANRAIRVETSATPSIVSPMEYFLLQASSTITRVLQEPIVLQPGYAMHVETGGAPTQLNASFEWVEETI